MARNFSRTKLVTQLTIDSTKAEGFLEEALRRPLRKSVIYGMAIDMLCGYWLETSPFMFYWDEDSGEDKMIDGANRCAAVIRAQKLLDQSTGDEGWAYHEEYAPDKVKIKVMALYGMPKEMILSLDRGTKRQPGDLLCAYYDMFQRRPGDSWAGDAIRMSKLAYSALEFYYDREWGVPDWCPDSLSPYLLPGLDALFGPEDETKVVVLLEKIVRNAYGHNKIDRHSFKPDVMEITIAKAFQVCMADPGEKKVVFKWLKDHKEWTKVDNLWQKLKEKGVLR